MNRLSVKLVPIATAVLLSCSSGKDSADTMREAAGTDTMSVGFDTADPAGGLVVSGSVQKGPFIIGSEIQVAMLDDGTGDATGEVFHTTTRSYLGEYELTLPRASMVEVVGSGYYFNELENRTSAAFLTLHALAEITDEGEQNIYANVLTQVSYLRAARLIEEGAEFHEAIRQAESEFMSRMSVVLVPPDAPGAASSMNMIGGDTGDNAYLLALSCVLLQAAVDDVEDGEGVETNTEAALQSILNVAALELEETGMFEASKWINGAHNLNTQTCFRNMKTFVREEGSLDEAIAVPNIARILDSDGDGIVDMADDDADGDGFTEEDGDCDDSERTVYPGSEESCDGLDNNCDGERDEGFSRVSYWADMDEDGHGDPDVAFEICDSISSPAEPDFDAEELLDMPLVGGFESMESYVARMLESLGLSEEDSMEYEEGIVFLEGQYEETYTAYTQDCDDTDASVNPDATEVCDGIDNDCDDSIDEDAEGGVDAYLDVDEDGLYSTEATIVCDDTISYTLTSPLDDEDPRDCDDDDADGTNTYTDADCDGVVTDDDCDDNDGLSTFIAADADCDGVVNDTDEDGDGVADYCGFEWDYDHTDESIAPDDATFNDCNDCNDSDPSIGSSDDDADCDGVATDDDCDDGDAAVGNTGTTRSTESPDGTVTILDGDCDGVLTEDDCDDGDAASSHMADDADCDGARFYEDCDDADASSTVVADDADCDGVLTADDCDDSSASSTTFATDADCDDVLTVDDCDDTDPLSTIRSEDGDCDGHIGPYDCDDEDSTSTVLAEDADCDGVLTADDCNDSSATSTTHATDADCDGVLTEYDCDDDNDTVGYSALDADCDGVTTAADCDDNDASSTTVATDADCDGTLTVDDCDDSEAALNDHDADGDGQSTCEHDCDDGDVAIYQSAPELCDGIDSDCDSDLVDEFDDLDADGIPECESCDDADGDGVSTCEDDCDDDDASLGSIHNDADCDGSITEDDCDDDDTSMGDESNDYDCDGVVTADDCDDYYASFGDSAFDADCDGTVTEEDCDESSPWAAYSTTVATDADCDGIVTADDCNDDDATSTRVATDADCDGVLTADDCDDTDPDSTTVATDADCDGTVTEEDCDDTIAYWTTIATDADCDGILTEDDCDDSGPSTTIGSDGDCDGVVTADDCDDTDPDSTTVANDADCDGATVGVIGVHDDCDDDDPSLGSSGEDADCDGVLTADDCDDEDADSTTVATDADCDGFTALGLPWPYSDDDCDDSDASINPDADELCDGIDNDCDDSIDEDAVDMATFYLDSDGDGYGDDDAAVMECSAPDGYVDVGGDCNDSNRRVNPGVVYDRPGDGLDNDCDGEIDEGW
jgi:hypothetical protein